MAANLNEKRRQYTSYNRVKLNNIVTQYLKMSEYRGKFPDKNFLLYMFAKGHMQ